MAYRPNVTNPSLPCFQAWLSSTASNVTGAGGVYQIAFDQENFDVGSNFTTGASAHFTAPVTGKYFFSGTVLIQPQTIALPTITLSLIATGLTLDFRSDNIATTSGQNLPRTFSGLISMTAGDTCKVVLVIGGGVGDTSGVFGFNNAAYFFTYFSGFLVA